MMESHRVGILPLRPQSTERAIPSLLRAPSEGLSPFHDVIHPFNTSLQVDGLGLVLGLRVSPLSWRQPTHPQHHLTRRRVSFRLRVRSDFLGAFGTITISAFCTTCDVILTWSYLELLFSVILNPVFSRTTLAASRNFTLLAPAGWWPVTSRFLELLLSAILNKLKLWGQPENLAPYILLTRYETSE